MPDSPYQNRELDAKFANLLEHMKDFEKSTKEVLDRIEIQTTKTNGSVASLKTWRTYIIGFLAGLAMAFGILAYFVGQVFIPLADAEIQVGK